MSRLYRPIVRAIAGLVCLSNATAASAQVQPQEGAARVLLAVVLDRSGRPTVDVGPDDFVIEEGNDERDVLSVQVADYPVTLLLDNGMEAEDTLAVLRQGALRFIRRIGQRPIAVATLADPPQFVATFEDERGTVLAAVEAMTPVPRSPLRPLAALAQAATRIADFGSPFSVVVVLSTGTVDPAAQPEADRIAPVVDSGAVVHVIALRPATPIGADGPPDLLRAVSAQTRGQFTSIYSPVSFGIALDRLADQLSTEIMVEYLVPRGTSGENARVGIRVPGARVRGLGVSR